MQNGALGHFGLIRADEDSCGSREYRFCRSIAALYVAFILILVTPNTVLAQATATLSGVIRDPSDAVIPKATVTLHNTETGTERQRLTNDSGLYVFVSVPPGEYSLTVTKAGFASATRPVLHV